MIRPAFSGQEAGNEEVDRNRCWTVNLRSALTVWLSYPDVVVLFKLIMPLASKT